MRRRSRCFRCSQHGFTQIVNGQYDLRRVQEYVATNQMAESQLGRTASHKVERNTAPSELKTDPLTLQPVDGATPLKSPKASQNCACHTKPSYPSPKDVYRSTSEEGPADIL